MNGTAPESFRTVVVGGGISGLAAAWRLLELGREPRAGLAVTLLERERRPGGQIRTERRGEFLIEGGPDTLLAQKKSAVELCARIGLGGDVEDLGPRPAWIRVVRRGRLVPVPEGFAILAPSRLGPVLASPLFSWRGKLRLLAEPLVPRSPESRDDESLASFVARRYGREVLDRVAEPIAASLYMADADRMSLRMTMPRFLDLERREGSVTGALRRASRRGAASPFVSLRGGLERIVETLAAALPPGVVRTSAEVERIEPPGPSGAWRLHLPGGERLEADGVVLACPSFEAARLLRAADPSLAAGLDRLAYASCATVHLAYRAEEVRGPLDGFGFFVPRTEGLPILACSFVSEKFPGRAPRGTVVLRTFVGGALRPDALDRDDAALVALAAEALTPLLGIRGEPILAAVHRHLRAMPQYEVGAMRWVGEIAARAAAHPGLTFAGSVTGAVGVPDCVRSGEEAARAIAALAGRVAAGADLQS